MTSKHTGKRSLEEMLALSNEQILSKWSTLASFIRLNEYDETNPNDWSKGWHPSREKAIYLLNTSTAEDYINKVRGRFASSTSVIEPKVQEIESTKESVQIKTPKLKRSIYNKNYDRLVRLIPDLEDRIAKRKDLHGLSNTIGFHGIILLKQIGKKNHITDLQIYHYVQDGKNYRVETMLTIRIDVAKMTVEPLLFQCKNGSCRVYHHKEGIENVLLDTKEQERQNKLLSDFLKSLLLNRHRFEWIDDTKNDLFYTLSRFQFSYDADNEVEETLIDVNSVLSDVIEKQADIESKIEKQEAKRKEKRERKDREAFKKMVFEYWKENINEEIPEFEPGNVEYIDVFEELGITKDDIEWINENETPISFFPNSEKGITGFELQANGKIRFA